MNFDPLRRFLMSLEENRLPSCEMRVNLRGQEAFVYSKVSSPSYLAYSLTKPVTCALALKFFERGAFTMDDRLSDFIPEFRDMRVNEVLPDGTRRERPAKRPITMRDLFTMSAGFGYDFRRIRPLDTLSSVKEFASDPLLFDPGEHWNYSLCHDVLGAVIEVISGKKFRNVLRDEITSPLGMHDTLMLGEVTDESSVSPLYDAKGNLIPLDYRFTPSKEYDSGGAGLVTTLYDYSLFCEALLSGRVINPHTLSLMTVDHLTNTTRKDFIWPQTRGYGYGLGVRVLTDRAAAGSPSPIGEFGWGGISGSYSLMDPENEITCVFMAHCVGTDEVYLYPRLRNVLYACL